MLVALGQGLSGYGVGAEFGVFFDDTGGVLGGLSVDAVVQPPAKHRRTVVPFFAVGYSALTGPETEFTTWNLGGGVTWWSRDRLGVRVDVRDHIGPQRFPAGREHYWALRVGVAFR